MAAIADLVAPGGQLLVLADLRPEGAAPEGPPWRLRPEELDAFAAAGLVPQELVTRRVRRELDRERVVASYRRD
jgi:hypothetical protein